MLGEFVLGIHIITVMILYGKFSWGKIFVVLVCTYIFVQWVEPLIKGRAANMQP